MSELVEVSFYLVVCFHIKKYKLTSLHLLGIVPFFWHEQPKSMIKVKKMPCILGYSGLQRKRDVSWQKDIALEGPLNGQPQPIMCIWELTDSPGISLQSLRWVPFPTHGVLPWAPHTRLLICKPESSQADHSDQAIQPPKHRKEKQKIAISRNPDKHKATSNTRRTWKPMRPPKLSPPAATNLPGQPNSPNTPKSVCDVNRIGRVNPRRVCLVHSGDVCLLSQALVPFPRSRRPSSKQRLLPKRKDKIPNCQLLALNHALAALFHPVFKSTGVEGAQATAMKSWWKS